MKIEEKDIERLECRDEALEMGFELRLYQPDSGKVLERIAYGKTESINGGLSSDNYLNHKAFNTTKWDENRFIPWFDIKKLEIRKMTLVEIHDYLIENKKLLCYMFGNGSVAINVRMNDIDIDDEYHKYGTLNADGTFKPLIMKEK